MTRTQIAGIILLASALMPRANAAESSVSVYEADTEPTVRGRIDELVFGRLQQLGITAARVCSDGVFVRRVYLDITGTLPTATEARQFLRDADPDKRSKLIDRLLERDEYADYWAMRWCDLLRVKSEFPIKLWPNAVQAYHGWVRACVRDNVPYDRFVREMLTGSGSNFRDPQVNFYRAVQSREPQAIAQAVALSFMGVRPERWPQQRWSGMAAFFSQIAYKPTVEWKEEIVIFDLEKSRSPQGTESLRAAAFPDSAPVQLVPGDDPRKTLADWLVHPKNPWFTRNIVNRVWFWLMGRGIIHPPDDICPENPPVNPELLACLEQDLIAAHYDLKHLYREILNSTTYQLSCVPRSDNPIAAANFAYCPLRRLEAEVLIDALCQITGTSEQYSSIIPEPYTFMPKDQRAVALADASITSPFLEKFGRSSRDTGLESDRNNRPTAAQRLHLLNSSHIRRKLETSHELRAILAPDLSLDDLISKALVLVAPNPIVTKIAALMTPDPEVPQTISEIYLTALSRMPTNEELEIAATHMKATWGDEGPRDILWTLINTPEFSYRH
jgi:hypothetical protein